MFMRMAIGLGLIFAIGAGVRATFASGDAGDLVRPVNEHLVSKPAPPTDEQMGMMKAVWSDVVDWMSSLHASDFDKMDTGTLTSRWRSNPVYRPLPKHRPALTPASGNGDESGVPGVDWYRNNHTTEDRNFESH